MTSGIRKGIVLAGGSGSRLYPVTRVACKQLLPIYDKPLVFYPLATLMQCGIREIALISTPEDESRYWQLFGDGSHLGLSIEYLVQPNPEGIAQAFVLAEEFIGADPVMLILGDNIFHGLEPYLAAIHAFSAGALIFGYSVLDPSRYGVIQFSEDGQPRAIIEKPERPPSSYAVTGLYAYDNRVVQVARDLRPSSRGELEITDVNQWYLDRGELQVEKLGRGVAWLDSGTHESMLEAGNFIATVERRQGQKIACLEELAFHMGFITRKQLTGLTADMPDNSYRDYLRKLLNDHE